MASFTRARESLSQYAAGAGGRQIHPQGARKGRREIGELDPVLDLGGSKLRPIEDQRHTCVVIVDGAIRNAAPSRPVLDAIGWVGDDGIAGAARMEAVPQTALQQSGMGAR